MTHRGRVASIEPARFDITIDPSGHLHLPPDLGGVALVDAGIREQGAHAWLAAITRL